MIMLPADSPDDRPLALALSRNSSSHSAVLAVAMGSAVKYFTLEAQLSLFPSGGYRELKQWRVCVPCMWVDNEHCGWAATTAVERASRSYRIRCGECRVLAWLDLVPDRLGDYM